MGGGGLAPGLAVAGLLLTAVGCDGFLASKCALRPALPECTDLIAVEPTRLSRSKSEELLRVELAQESVARELDLDTKASLEIAQDGGPILLLEEVWHEGRTLWARIPQAELSRLRGGAAQLTVRVGERLAHAPLSVYTPPVYSGAPTIRETQTFSPERVIFHPQWRKEGPVLQPLLVQGTFDNSGLGDPQKARACWLSASLDILQLSTTPSDNEIKLLNAQCPLTGVGSCKPSFDGNGCLVELCVTSADRLVRSLYRFGAFESVPAMPDPSWKSLCPPTPATPQGNKLTFALDSQLQIDPHSNLVGVLWQSGMDPRPPPGTIDLFQASQLEAPLPHSIEGQGFAISQAALGDLDQPVATPRAQQTGDLVALSQEGTVKILLQKPSSFRELAEPAWRLGQQLKAPGPLAFQHYNGLAVADVDGDGWKDIVILGQSQGGKARLVYAANLEGKELAPLVDLPLHGALDARFASAGLSVGDADGDGDMDLVLFVNQNSPGMPGAPWRFLALVRNEAR